MADTSRRYPLSTAQGDSIPLDVIRPVSAVATTITSASASSAITIPSIVEIVIMLSDVDCWAKFASSASVAAIPTNNTITADLLFVPANLQLSVAPPPDKKSLSFIAASTSGRVVTQLLETWTGTSLQSQQPRR